MFEQSSDMAKAGFRKLAVAGCVEERNWGHGHHKGCQEAGQARRGKDSGSSEWFKDDAQTEQTCLWLSLGVKK